MHRERQHHQVLCVPADDADLHDLCVFGLRDNDVTSITFQTFMIRI